MTAERRVLRFGDGALRLEAGRERPVDLAGAVDGLGLVGVREVVVGHGTVTVVVDPDAVDLDGLAEELAGVPAAAVASSRASGHELPVAFDGDDLDEVAAACHLAPAEVVAQLAAARFVVELVGFVPGFGYLRGLEGALADLGRRSTPRRRLRAGSVAVAGGYAGVYPVATPGGWHVVGHCGAPLFDRTAPPYARLRPGDEVRFVPVDAVEAADEPERARLRAPGRERAVVVDPGALATVQDLGRLGHAALGVPQAGSADRDAAAVANLAVGNAAACAVVEMTLLGASLRFDTDRLVAVVGAEAAVDGRPLARGAVQPVAGGQLLEVAGIGPGPRAYLAVAGGFCPPPVLDSASTDTLCGLGPGPLAAGDELALGPPGRARGRFVAPGDGDVLHLLAGPDAEPGELEALCAGGFVVGAGSDRIGVRLVPDPAGRPPAPRPAVAGSQAMVTGAVQLPPDGEPIVLGVDHATLGGYRVVAAVASADLGRLGRLAPGEGVTLVPVDAGEARRLRELAARARSKQVASWYPVEAG